MSEPNAKRKSFKLFDAILSVICVVFVAEAAAPAAAIGNSQYFWWLFLIVAFLYPYGMIAAELGTTYDDEGGLYDWVKRAYGSKWGSRCAWYYWINFPLWMASLAVIFPQTISLFIGQPLGVVPSLIIELVIVWGSVFISFFPVSDSKWILNAAAVIKVVLALMLGCLGIYGAVTRGLANEYTVRSLLPSFDLNSLSHVSVILFNFMGFEIVTTFSSEMESPKKQIPQAIIAGGLTIAAIYLFSAFGIGAAIPSNEITGSTGLVGAIQLLTGSASGILVLIAAVLFLLSLIGNLVSWSYGVNYVAMYAAKNHDMPGVFAKESKKHNMPVGAAVMNGVVASVLLIIAPFLPSKDLFWSFFALNIVTLLMAYLPLFPGFLKLRKIDPDRERPFKVAGGKGKLTFMAYAPVVLLVISIIFCVVPLSLAPEELSTKIPLSIGVLVAVVIGEVISAGSAKKKGIAK